MANSLNINSSVNGTVNGLNVNQSSNASLTPTGSTLFAESVLVPTSGWLQVVTGSSQPISVIYAANTSTTASLNLAISASGIVSNLGSVSPSNGSTNNGSLIQWNGTFTALYAQSTLTSSYGVFVVSAQ